MTVEILAGNVVNLSIELCLFKLHMHDFDLDLKFWQSRNLESRVTWGERGIRWQDV